ncbi:helix-turn-helix domain-containing protein [Micromonospora sp. CB01531]|uniref:helix-turn-helix domain-containing protein n=1 Tax=Micromonospora sp. CB01531 TaxID=1718947 RepID=UPI0009F8581C|nr:helix-turn-helix domain-containing protein [Micromonospora sp. CB01531]
MSAAVKFALLATRDLGKNERAVAIAIAAHANHEGNAWPSVATIAEYAGCSERTVQRCLAKLVQLGRLVVSRSLASPPASTGW